MILEYHIWSDDHEPFIGLTSQALLWALGLDFGELRSFF